MIGSARCLELAVCAALLFPACSDGAPTDMGPAQDLRVPIADFSTAAPPDLARGDQATTPAVHTVTVAPSGMLVFEPPSLIIRAGDIVHWVWGATGHTVNSGNPGAPDARFCSPSDTACAAATNPTSTVGATYDHPFAAAGSFPYFCRVHGVGGMTGDITVQ